MSLVFRARVGATPVLLALLAGTYSSASAANIPPFFLDCVVSIGYRGVQQEQEASGQQAWRRRFIPMGTGFLYGDHLPEVGSTSYRVYLVTNRHVIRRIQAATRNQLDQLVNTGTIEERDKYLPVVLRFNPKSGAAARDDLFFPLAKTEGSNDVLYHDAHDLAIVPINTAFLDRESIQYSFFRSDKHVLNRDQARDAGLSEGDGVFVLGFPMGILGGDRSYVIARRGIIARVRDALSKKGSEFLVDAFVFPGNSGGPVINAAQVFGIDGTKSINAAHLIGIIKSYIPYRDVAVSGQTQRPRVIFEENSGLASVIPVDFLEELIMAYKKSIQTSIK